MEWSANSGHNLQYARRKGLSGGTGDGKCWMAATARWTSFVCMAGSGWAHRCSSIYPGFGSIYFRFHTAWWDHWGACFLFMSYSSSISSNSCKLAALWKQHCLTAPSMWSGHPTGMWGSSEGPLPFCSMIVRNMGTSIVALRLTWTRLHFHVSCQEVRGLYQPLCPCRAYTSLMDGDFHVSCQELRGLYQPRCPCRAYTSLMDGDYTRSCQPQTTCHAQK